MKDNCAYCKQPLGRGCRPCAELFKIHGPETPCTEMNILMAEKLDDLITEMGLWKPSQALLEEVVAEVIALGHPTVHQVLIRLPGADGKEIRNLLNE